MKNITQQFNSGYEPFKALLIYRHNEEQEINQFQRKEQETQIYVESYDIGKDGRPINAHPFTLKEMTALQALLDNMYSRFIYFLLSHRMICLRVK